MDLDIMTLIGQYAFPIVGCMAMGYYVKYTEDKHREERDRMADNHSKEINSITEVINNNTVVLKELCIRLESILKGDDDDD